MSKPVENALASLFERELEYQRTINQVKKLLNSRYDFTVKRCWNEIDKAKPYTVLDRNEIRDFVKQYDTKLSEDELDAIIRRCDTDEDEQISELEFKDVVKHQLISPVMSKFLSRFSQSSTKKTSSLKLSDLTSKVLKNRSSKRVRDSSFKNPDTPSRTIDYSRSTKIRNSSLEPSNRLTRSIDYRSMPRLTTSDLFDRYRYLRYYDRYEPVSTYYRRLSPIRYRYRYWSPVDRQSIGWRSLLSRYYNRDLYRYSPQRYTWADLYRSRFATDTQTKVKRPESGTKAMYDTFSRETISSRAKKVAPSTTLKQETVSSNTKTYASPTTRMSSVRISPPKSRSLFKLVTEKAKQEYSPAKKQFTTRFDVADEFIEEHDAYTPIKTKLGSSSKKSYKTASTLNAVEKDEFVDSLIDLVNLDRQLENALKSLAMRPDFTLIDGFGVFDYDNMGYADMNDIVEAFQIFDLRPSREEARLFLHRFDQNKNDRLNYSEFCEAFIPNDEKCAEILRNRSKKYPDGYYYHRENFNQLTHAAFAKVLKLHLDTVIKAEEIRQRHENRPMFHYEDAFNTLNQWGDDYLTVENFDQIFKDYNFYATENELETLVNRFDKNKDGMVSFGEFVEEFSPHSPLKFTS